MGNSIEEDIARIAKLITTKFNNDYSIDNKDKEAIEHILSDYKRVLKEVKRYKNMYEAEHQIHLVRNEQLDRKQKAIIKCNELENENKELKKENEKLKHKIEGQECVIETQAHNEEVYEKLVMKLEKENEEIEEKDKIINVMAEYISKKEILVDKHCYALTAEAVKQWFEKQIK